MDISPPPPTVRERHKRYHYRLPDEKKNTKNFDPSLQKSARTPAKAPLHLSDQGGS